jgi:hypothetical protein
MKYAFLLLACLGSALLTHAQINKPAADQNRVTVTLSNNIISVSSKSKAVIVHSNEALDSCLQKIIPGLDHPTILLDAPNDMDQEKNRAIRAVLEKFHCPVMSFRKFEPDNPPATRRLDTVGH